MKLTIRLIATLLVVALWSCEETRFIQESADTAQSPIDTTSDAGSSDGADATDDVVAPADTGGGDTSTDATDGIDGLDQTDGVDGTDQTDGVDGTDQTDGVDGVAGGLVYAHTSPPAEAPDDILAPQAWLDHVENDLLPFWLQTAALGTPVGNYPTYRDMTGATTSTTERRPRMIGRQVFTYCAAFLLTGNTELLAHARAGAYWLIDNAWDDQNGGWHALLDSSGAPLGTDPKTAQDAAYAALGLSAWFFVTRDPGVEGRLLDTRDMLMEGALWDTANQRVKDAVSVDLNSDVDVENDGGSELVAQLDALNAFMMLSQRVLTQANRRAQFLTDMQTLSQILVDDFFSDGMFWGVDSQIGQYSTRHVDFGHNLKTFWMIWQVDKRLGTPTFRSFLNEHLRVQLERAYDADRGRWGKRPTSTTDVEYGSDWWIWAECEQLAATLNMQGGDLDPWLTQTAAAWFDFVDDTRPARELVPTLDDTGAWVFQWPENDTAKANQWKSGYHGLEHALVMYLHGHWRAGTAAKLYFAPVALPNSFAAPPYIFDGVEASRTITGTTTVDGTQHSLVEVTYTDLW